jgi:hypothetical protein
MIEPMIVVQVENEGGYLVPEFVWIDAPGARAWAMRTAGCIFNRHDWYRKGMQRHNFWNELSDIINRKERLAVLFK